MNEESRSSHTFTKWIGGAALGALAMYLADPNHGRRRRAVARDKMRSVLTKSGSAVSVASRDLNNRLQGLRAEANRRFLHSHDAADDEVLVARVRTKIGRAVSHPHAIKVEASQGRVTLSGPILADELGGLLRMVKMVPGVMELSDQLEVHESGEHIAALQGEGRPRQPRASLLQRNLPPGWRAAATVGGGMLSCYGVLRRTPGSLALAALGVGLLARGLSNTRGQRMRAQMGSAQAFEMRKNIHIAAEPQAVYAAWRNYENFPRFMSNVERVEDLGGGRSHWVVSGPAGARLEWDSRLTEDRPERMSWQSEPNDMVEQAGTVSFQPMNGGTMVEVEMTYRPPGGIAGKLAASMFDGSPEKQLEDDLQRMKEFLERGGATTRMATPVSASASEMHSGETGTPPGTPLH